MIELTDEMFNAFYEAGVDRDFLLSDTRAGLAAVLAIVERDYRIKPRRKPSWRDAPGCLCAPTGRPYRLCPVHGEAAS